MLKFVNPKVQKRYNQYLIRNNMNTLSSVDEQKLIKEFNTVSQLSHVGWGIMIMLLFNTIGKNIGIDIIGLGLWILYTGIKEFWYDEKYEIPVVRGSSSLDFCMQVGGAIVGMIIILIFK